MVAVDPSLHCGRCYYCRRGRGNLCENWAAIGVTEAGGAAEFVAVPARNCYHLPDTRRPGRRRADRAAVVRGPRVRRAAARDGGRLPHLRRRHDGPDDAGAGEAGRRRHGVRRGHQPGAAGDGQAAGLLGRRHQGRRTRLRPRGWDVVIDCTGAGPAIADGLNRVGKGGTFLQFGVASYDTRATIEPYKIYNQEITITGSMAVLHSFERAGAVVLVGRARPEHLHQPPVPAGQVRRGDRAVPGRRRAEDPGQPLISALLHRM